MLTLVLTFIAGVASVCAIVYAYLVQHFHVWKRRGIKGPSPAPLLGTVPSSVLLNRHYAYDLHTIYEEYKETENVVGIFYAKSPALLVVDGKTCRDVLVNKFNSFRDNSTGHSINDSNNPIFGANVFFTNGENWKLRRNQITPAYTTRKMAGMFPTIAKNVKNIHKVIANHTSKSIEVKELASSFTAQNVSELIFDLDAKAFEASPSLVKTTAKTMVDNYFWQQQCATLLDLPGAKQLLRGPIFDTAAQKLCRKWSAEAIERRGKSCEGKEDFLNYLLSLQERKGLSFDNVVNHLSNIFFDGFESSGVTITQCLHLLARNERVQTKLREELRSAELDANSEVTYATLCELRYLDQCINETLRLFVPGKDLAKICTENCTLEDKSGKAIQILKGDSITIPLYSLHRDDRYYKQPNSFDPDRFSEENGGTKYYRDLGVFMPFGDGPRICPAVKFAQMQVKMALFEIITRYEVQPDFAKMQEVIEIHPTSFACEPRGGVHLFFREI